MENNQQNRDIRYKLKVLATNMYKITPKQLIDALEDVIKVVKKNNNIEKDKSNIKDKIKDLLNTTN